MTRNQGKMLALSRTVPFVHDMEWESIPGFAALATFINVALVVETFFVFPPALGSLWQVLIQLVNTLH